MGAVVALDESTVEDVLRARGLRATSARRLVLRSLSELGHATPEQLFTSMSPRLRGLSLSTIYRTVESLAASGLVRHAHLTGTTPSYYLTQTSDHAHLICSNCGQITNLSGRSLATLLRQLSTREGFTPNTSHLSLEGLCRDCTTG